NMCRGNVRNKPRRANEEPPNVAPRQKVFFARPLAPRKVESDPKHNQKVDADDRQIQIRKCLMRCGNLCRKKHSSLPWAPSPPWRAALTVFFLRFCDRIGPAESTTPSLHAQCQLRSRPHDITQT